MLGALSLINYESDSSDDENDNYINNLEKPYDSAENVTPKLPVPSFLANTSSKNDNYEETCSLKHNGRIRTFPHERGIWATYVYIPYEPTNIILDFKHHIVSKLGNFKMQPIEHYHISLTKTLVLKHHWIDMFVDSIRNKVTGVKSFSVGFGHLQIYCNEEKTRTFIGMNVDYGYESLLSLVNCIDNSLQDFKLPLYYKDPCFHLSLTWCIGDYAEKLSQIISELQHDFEKVLLDYQDIQVVSVSELEIKCGNKIFKIEFD